jgi:hypothetical protein
MRPDGHLVLAGPVDRAGEDGPLSVALAAATTTDRLATPVVA